MTILYSIGVDFGTESGRILLINVHTGEIAGTVVIPYKHGVIVSNDERIPYELPFGTALQDPQDYLEVLLAGIPQVLEKVQIDPSQIIGMGFDFTSSTVLPVDRQYVPLCFKREFQTNHHAWVKLWKHRLEVPVKDKMYMLAKEEDAVWFRRLGQNISEEWAIPKIYETFLKAPDVFHKAAYFIEAGDWVTTTLTGELTRNNCGLGFKAYWTEEDGFPNDYFKSIHPDFGHSLLDKLAGPVKNIGERAGTLSKEWADKLLLPVGLPVAACIIDAHSAVIGHGVSKSGTLLMVIGTSTCHLMVHEELKKITGISVVKDAIIPGLYAYEAGQPAVGDLFGSFVKNHIPASYEKEAQERNISLYRLLEQKASIQAPGESGLLALDWHNGTRSPLSNPNLSGIIAGLTLHTKPEEIFRAYLEATAFSAKKIIAAYVQAGMEIKEIIASGGIPQRNRLLMQIYADVLNMPIHISHSEFAPGIGASILGAVASTSINGGYDTVDEAMANMVIPSEEVSYPIDENVQTYLKLYTHYEKFHNYFGVDNPSLMSELMKLRKRTNALKQEMASEK
ncbi:ribulokinase [Neobacillus mesonae]|uniref:ribulokinase n=1 Tax=Neobacillus mesonae TaxID=1193713 RepID=UPI00203CC1A5|nr:ribulokinase [Neobacillus mesonae]MCM3571156.1 ribulokinase [Neobacillus mesonae]